MEGPAERVLGIPMPRSTTARLAVVTGAVICTQLGHGVVQEALFRQPGFRFGAMLSLCDLLVYALLASAQEALQRGAVVQPVRELLRSHAVLVCTVATLLVVNLVLGNVSLQYLTYPTKVVFKVWGNTNTHYS